MDLITELEKLIDELQSIIAEGMGGPHGYNKTHIADALGMQNRLRAILATEPEAQTFDELSARWYREDRNIVALVAAAREALNDADGNRKWRERMRAALAPFEHREVT